jgi:NDP-sugar pyrophosphorylase family protein
MQVVVFANEPPSAQSAHGEPLPASLISLHGKPLVDWQLDAFVASGARRVVMLVAGAGGEEIETHVRRALDRGLMVAYSYAGGEATGSGSTLRRAFARLEDDFVLTWGDRYLPLDYSAPLRDLREHPEASATLGVSPKPPGARGHAAVDGNWVTRYEPKRAAELDYVDGGVVALRRSVLNDIADGAVWNVEALWRKLARERKLRAFVLPEQGYDVASPEGQARLERHLASQPIDGPAP